MQLKFTKMKTKLKKYGANSQAVVIPKAILELFGISPDTEFSIETENNQLVIRPDSTDSKVSASIKKMDAKYGKLFQRLANK